MVRYPLFTAGLMIAVCLSCGTGCLMNVSKLEVLRQDEPVRALTFESEHARNVFESHVSHAQDDDGFESNVSFGIPFIIGVETTEVVSPSAIRNDVATRFDLNSDNHISDYEASLRAGGNRQ